MKPELTLYLRGIEPGMRMSSYLSLAKRWPDMDIDARLEHLETCDIPATRLMVACHKAVSLYHMRYRANRVARKLSERQSRMLATRHAYIKSVIARMSSKVDTNRGA